MQVRMIRSMTGPEGTECSKNGLYEIDAETAQRWIDGGVAETVSPAVVAADAEESPRKSRRSTATPAGE